MHLHSFTPHMQTKPLVSTALDFLNGLLSSATVPDVFKLPKVGVTLTTVGGSVEHLLPPDTEGNNEWTRPQEHVLCEVNIDRLSKIATQISCFMQPCVLSKLRSSE